MPRHFISCVMPKTPMPQALEMYCKSSEGVSLLLPDEPANGKVKKLRFARDTEPGMLIEQFESFCVLTSFSASASVQGCEIAEYERLKSTLAFGLRAGVWGLSGADALRIFMFYLLSNGRKKDAAKMLQLSANALQIDACAAAAKAEIDLLAIALEASNSYFAAREMDYSTLITLLLLQECKTSLVLEFARFFRAHKKATTAQGALKILKKVNDARTRKNHLDV